MASSEDINLEAPSIGEKAERTISLKTSIEITQTTVNEEGIVHTVSEKIDAFDFYSCEEAIKRLNDYLDSELDPAEKEDVLKHLQICDPCLERFHFEKSLITEMRKRMCRSVAPMQLKERLAALMKNGL